MDQNAWQTEIAYDREHKCGFYKLTNVVLLVYSTSRPGASRESVLVRNRGPVVEGYPLLLQDASQQPLISRIL